MVCAAPVPTPSRVTEEWIEQNKPQYEAWQQRQQAKAMAVPQATLLDNVDGQTPRPKKLRAPTVRSTSKLNMPQTTRRNLFFSFRSPVNKVKFDHNNSQTIGKSLVRLSHPQIVPDGQVIETSKTKSPLGPSKKLEDSFVHGSMDEITDLGDSFGRAMDSNVKGSSSWQLPRFWEQLSRAVRPWK